MESNEDIINHPSFSQLKYYNVFKRRAPKLGDECDIVAAQTTIISNWHFKFVPSVSGRLYYWFIVYGVVKGTFIKSSMVLDVVNNIVKTENSFYKLEGEMSPKCNPHRYFNAEILECFRKGFPSNWRSLIEEEIKKVEIIESTVEKYKENKDRRPVVGNVYIDKEVKDIISNVFNSPSSESKVILEKTKNQELQNKLIEEVEAKIQPATVKHISEPENILPQKKRRGRKKRIKAPEEDLSAINDKIIELSSNVNKIRLENDPKLLESGMILKKSEIPPKTIRNPHRRLKLYSLNQENNISIRKKRRRVTMPADIKIKKFESK